ncbi:acyl-ACP--UDP-N-acetylglucosamine O-acyltransferase [Dysgonomonas gadei]|uniref:Acyl-[acyl-carrier-protein]-UDP-N-acetylglucosamine O-acyltransferase n=1 Tax=Dysgonomonas gadei ATCC BAA-286 TaxID=742766 RepID=F5IUL8_9BACT|nr:acyl-ACP--UDP-N-acetylglucosamine O-acyltransferase [Dysgonomonas gadei]EGK02918.1 acyl-[acyl-carrier-protein]-UDP-N-acetylglucosamine O-acyltransferase [Dysgonomonas gadei ATCC BAA-286]
MSNISHQAYVHPEAILGENVVIEPFAFVDKNVEIGDGTLVMSGANIRYGACVGKDCRIFPGAVIGGLPQDLKFRGEDSLAIIGDNTTVRECVTVNRGTASKGYTKVGSNCLLMAYSHIAHDCVINDYAIVGNATQLAGEVEVDHHAILSGGTLVHQFTRIGAHVMIQGGTRLGKDIPPYIIAGREPVCYSGVNLVGLRRNGYSNEKINEIQEIYRIIYQSGFNFSDAVSKIEKEFEETPEMRLIVDFVKNSPRGIVRGYMG